MTERKKVYRPVPGLSREEEEKELREIIEVAQNNLNRMKKRVGCLSEELHELMETYGTKNKEALSFFHNTQSQLLESRRDLERCRKARKKPYFGRIDFKDPNQPAVESYYVGRVGISDEASDPVVIDWRAPLASVYYENSAGICSYTVKREGSCTIDLKRKRTYEIVEDQLRDFYDSDVVANDELLTKYLAKNKKAVLGEIIATIQKEQNSIIRKSPKTNMIVQGVAGSGKTTVAMHRISYILYNYEEDFRPEDFYIIGSNRILLNYITGVLPDLDVYGVSQMTMEQLFVRLLYEDWDSQVCRICPVDRKNSTSRMKGSLAWFHDLEQFCRAYEERTVSVREVRMEKNGVVLVSESTAVRYLEQHPQLSVQSKINMLNEMVRSRLENELSGKYVSYTEEEKKELRRMYRWHYGKDRWTGSVYEVYEQFLLDQSRNGKGVTLAGARTFDVYDLAALAYLYKRIKETDGIREASHVIIDEAQDFGMMAYGALAYCLRGCTYTIMGDVSQNIYYGYGLNDWEELKKLILTGTYDSFGLLKKSYRNTVEISAFATDILRHGNFAVYPVEPIRRHGSDVRVTACSDRETMIGETVKTILEWQQEGRETIAVVCRDENEASEVRKRLALHLTVADSSPETAEFGSGVMVLPVEYTKGLEFDAVLIYDPSSEKYPAEDPYVKLLYVAATRALHELAVVHQGDLTELIGKPVSEKKCMESLEKRKFREEAEDSEKNRTADRKIDFRKKDAAADRKTDCRKQDGAVERKTGCGKQNKSPYPFRSVPDSGLLRPASCGRADHAIRAVKRTKTGVDLYSNYGILRLTPVADSIIRVQFHRDHTAEFAPGYWECEPDRTAAWTAKGGKNLVEIATEKIKARIDKRTGALSFRDGDGKLLLQEKMDMVRRLDERQGQAWVYFDWQIREKLAAKGILADDLERMNHKARYISFGGKQMRMPLLFSDYGYGIAVACERTVMCCNIPMYGPYLYMDGTNRIDYYFLQGENYGAILELYQRLTQMR